MRITILTQYFPPEVGASQTRLLSLGEALRHRGHDVRVVTGMPNYPEGRIQAGYRGRLWMEDEVEQLPTRRVWLYPAKGLGWLRLANYASFAVASLPALVATGRPDLLYVESPPLTLTPTAVLAARIWRVPLIMFVADLWPDSAVELGVLEPGWSLSVARSLERWAYRRVDCVSAPTRGVIERLHTKGIPRRQLVFLPNGVDTDRFSPRAPDEEMSRLLGIRSGQTTVLYAGTVGTVHGVGVAIRAMKQLQGTHPNVRLLVVGAGSDLENVRELVHTEGVSNVTFVPPQPLEQIARTWSVADVGLSTLRDLPVAEVTRPAKILAAMAAGKPVVYSGAGEGARLVTKAQAGIVAAPEDPAALAAAITRLIDDPGLAAELGMNGRAYVEQHLTWRSIVDRWLGELPRTSPRIAEALGT